MNALTKLIRRITNQPLLDRLFSQQRGLNRAAEEVLTLFIKEIDVLTTPKRNAIRRLKHQLKRTREA